MTSTTARSQFPSVAQNTFFPNANDVDIRGGNFQITRDYTSLTINLNGGPTPGSTPVITEDEQNLIEQEPALNSTVTATEPLFVGQHHESMMRWPSLPVQKSCDIYYRSLAVKGCGSPLWIPEPNTQLPLEYQRQGISIGDVGFITDYGGFNFLFNICLPVDHRFNPDILPDAFVPLSPGLQPTDVSGYSEFRPGSFLASGSQSIQDSRLGNPGGLNFEVIASQGAILTMPQGSQSMDLANIRRFRQYMSANIEHWYRYALNVRGLEVHNGDLRLVTGYHKTTAWGMATFANTTSRFRLRFIEREIDHTYNWESSGVAEVRVGPSPREIENFRANDSFHEDTVFENQCLCVRTLNATLQNDVWSKLASETDIAYTPDASKTPSSPSTSRRGRLQAPLPSSDLSPSYDGQSRSNQLYVVQADTSPKPMRSIHVESNASTTLPIHPSRVIHEKLLAKCPNVNVVITEDKDWISVLKDTDKTLPSTRTLWTRILHAHDICEDKDVAFLVPKEEAEREELVDSDSLDPSWSISESQVKRDAVIGRTLFGIVYKGTWGERSVTINVIDEPTFPVDLFCREMSTWTGLKHSNILATYGGSSFRPTSDSELFMVTPYLKTGNLVQYLQRRGRRRLPSSSRRPRSPPSSGLDLIRFIEEIATGMEYLHKSRVIHGTLNASSVLINEDDTCVITDFGKKEFRNTYLRKYNHDVGVAYLRWQSPEILTCTSEESREADVWAFAMTSVEVLTLGKLPWHNKSNAAIHQLILDENARPPIQKELLLGIIEANSLIGIEAILEQCWQRNPKIRPHFTTIVTDMSLKVPRSQDSIFELPEGRFFHAKEIEVFASAIQLPSFVHEI